MSANESDPDLTDAKAVRLMLKFRGDVKAHLIRTGIHQDRADILSAEVMDMFLTSELAHPDVRAVYDRIPDIL